MASGSHEKPLQLRIITCHVGFKSLGFHLELEVLGFHLELEDLGFHLDLEVLGFHLELEDLGFQSELEVFSNFWNCLVGRGCHVLFRVLCVPVQRHTVGQESKTCRRSGLVRPLDKADNLGS